MQKNRFGSGNRGKAFKCSDCQKNGLVGEERYFDNSTFPRSPICNDCKNNRQKTDAPLDPASANLEAAILRAWTQIKPELQIMLREALSDAGRESIVQSSELDSSDFV